MNKKNLTLLFIFYLFLIQIYAIDADVKDYQNIVDFSVKAANGRVRNGFRFFKVIGFNKNETSTGNQYQITLLYLDRVGMQDYFTIIIYENPWKELSILDIEEKSRR